MKTLRAMFPLFGFALLLALSGCVVSAGYPPPTARCAPGYYWTAQWGCVPVPATGVVIETPGVSYAIVAIDGLSLRTCPTTKCNIVTSLSKDEQVQVLRYEGSWAHVWAYRRGMEGWVAVKYLR